MNGSVFWLVPCALNLPLADTLDAFYLYFVRPDV